MPTRMLMAVADELVIFITSWSILRFRSSLWTCQSPVSVNDELFESTILHVERDQGESSPRLSRLVLSSHFLLPVRVSKCGAMEATSWPPATIVLRILLR